MGTASVNPCLCLTRLLAVVAQTLTARAYLGVVANVAAFVAGTAGEGRHGDIGLGLLQVGISQVVLSRGLCF